jgi:preprotein translocase subunit SecD
MSGEYISDAKSRTGLDLRAPHMFGVSMNLDAEGASIFRKVTETNIGRQLAIVVDGQVMSAPSIRSPIPSGKASIAGRFTDTEASDLATTLRTGSLPVPLRLVESKVLQNVP